LVPKQPTLDNYIKAWTLIPYSRYMANSFVIASASTVSVIVVSAMAAYSLTVLQVPGRNIVLGVILFGLIIPAQSGFIPVFMMVKNMGLIDTRLGVVLPYMSSAFGAFMLSQFFKVIPFDLVAAARIDGLREFGILMNVVLPLGKPGIITLIIFNFTGVWRDFFWPFLLINRKLMRTVPLGVVSFWQSESQHWGQILAATTIATIPLILVFLVFQKQFVRGISWSGMKA
jgi:multiple sugar transport system permease protein